MKSNYRIKFYCIRWSIKKKNLLIIAQELSSTRLSNPTPGGGSTKPSGGTKNCSRGQRTCLQGSHYSGFQWLLSFMCACNPLYVEISFCLMVVTGYLSLVL